MGTSNPFPLTCTAWTRMDRNNKMCPRALVIVEGVHRGAAVAFLKRNHQNSKSKLVFKSRFCTI